MLIIALYFVAALLLPAAFMFALTRYDNRLNGDYNREWKRKHYARQAVNKILAERDAQKVNG